MAIDRLLAVGRPIAYFQSHSLMRVYIGALVAFIFGSLYSFYAMWDVEESPAKQCSTGAAATPSFLIASSFYGVVMAILVFGTLIKNFIFT
uniref:G-protein coupled receptors family 1 profile domain-containing protein n=1 Tax=Acrobeloides nanus TaxID=290746 RepID=A0A914D267_9BILA